METTIRIFKALADRNRLRLLVAMHDGGELCACQLTELLEVTGATASRHLAQLQACGLVTSRKEGRWVYYRLQETTDLPGECAAVLSWALVRAHNSAELNRDRKRLRRILAVPREETCRRQRLQERVGNRL